MYFFFLFWIDFGGADPFVSRAMQSQPPSGFGHFRPPVSAHGTTAPIPSHPVQATHNPYASGLTGVVPTGPTVYNPYKKESVGPSSSSNSASFGRPRQTQRPGGSFVPHGATAQPHSALQTQQKLPDSSEGTTSQAQSPPSADQIPVTPKPARPQAVKFHIGSDRVVLSSQERTPTGNSAAVRSPFGSDSPGSSTPVAAGSSARKKSLTAERSSPVGAVTSPQFTQGGSNMAPRTSNGAPASSQPASIGGGHNPARQTQPQTNNQHGVPSQSTSGPSPHSRQASAPLGVGATTGQQRQYPSSQQQQQQQQPRQNSTVAGVAGGSVRRWSGSSSVSTGSNGTSGNLYNANTNGSASAASSNSVHPSRHSRNSFSRHSTGSNGGLPPVHSPPTSSSSLFAAPVSSSHPSGAAATRTNLSSTPSVSHPQQVQQSQAAQHTTPGPSFPHSSLANGNTSVASSVTSQHPSVAAQQPAPVTKSHSQPVNSGRSQPAPGAFSPFGSASPPVASPRTNIQGSTSSNSIGGDKSSPAVSETGAAGFGPFGTASLSNHSRSASPFSGTISGHPTVVAQFKKEIQLLEEEVDRVAGEKKSLEARLKEKNTKMRSMEIEIKDLKHRLRTKPQSKVGSVPKETREMLLEKAYTLRRENRNKLKSLKQHIYDLEVRSHTTLQQQYESTGVTGDTASEDETGAAPGAATSPASPSLSLLLDPLLSSLEDNTRVVGRCLAKKRKLTERNRILSEKLSILLTIRPEVADESVAEGANGNMNAFENLKRENELMREYIATQVDKRQKELHEELEKAEEMLRGERERVKLVSEEAQLLTVNLRASMDAMAREHKLEKERMLEERALLIEGLQQSLESLSLENERLKGGASTVSPPSPTKAISIAGSSEPSDGGWVSAISNVVAPTESSSSGWFW